MIWYDVVWSGMIWYDLVWSGQTTEVEIVPSASCMHCIALYGQQSLLTAVIYCQLQTLYIIIINIYVITRNSSKIVILSPEIFQNYCPALRVHRRCQCGRLLPTTRPSPPTTGSTSDLQFERNLSKLLLSQTHQNRKPSSTGSSWLWQLSTCAGHPWGELRWTPWCKLELIHPWSEFSSS